MSSGAQIVRLPMPPNGYNIQWANSLISRLEQMQAINNVAQSSANKTSEELAEAVSWFNG